MGSVRRRGVGEVCGGEWCGECVEESGVGVWRRVVGGVCGGQWCGECVEDSGVASVEESHAGSVGRWYGKRFWRGGMGVEKWFGMGR